MTTYILYSSALKIKIPRLRQTNWIHRPSCGLCMIPYHLISPNITHKYILLSICGARRKDNNIVRVNEMGRVTFWSFCLYVQSVMKNLYALFIIDKYNSKKWFIACSNTIIFILSWLMPYHQVNYLMLKTNEHFSVSPIDPVRYKMYYEIDV